MKISRPAWAEVHDGREEDVQTYTPGEPSRIVQLPMKSDSRKGSVALLSFSPRNVLYVAMAQPAFLSSS
jgi:hypothetical protein